MNKETNIILKHKKIIIIIAFLLLIATGFISYTSAYSDFNYKPKYGITTANLNFRKKSALSSATKIETVKKGSKVKMVGSIGSFYIVQLENNKVGLLAKQYVKETNESLKKAKVYTNLAKYYAYIKNEVVNVRGGPSTSFKIYTTLKKNDKIQVIGKIDNWNMIITENNTIGMIRSDLISKTKVTSTTSTTTNTSTGTSSSSTNTITTNSNANTVLNLINQKRKANGLSPLTADKALVRVAQAKSDDMVKNNYFSHTSPNFGDPFKMMQGFGITYKNAGENIAGNSNLNTAVENWLKSEQHRKNILSTSYNYIGIGVTKSNDYGYIIVAMFIGK